MRHLDATFNTNIRVVKSKLGRFEEALVQYGKAQEVFVEVYGDRHPESALNTMYIGNVYRQLSRNEEALFHYGKAQEMFIRMFGTAVHLLVAETQENSAMVYEQQEQIEKALQIYTSVLETKIQVCGAGSEPAARTCHNMACLHAKVLDIEQCRVMLEKAEKTGCLWLAVTPEHVHHDSDLDSVRHLDWFTAMVCRGSLGEQR